MATQPAYNKEEVNVLKLSRLFGDMVESEGWKEYSRVIQAQILTRENLAQLPVSEPNPAFQGMDFMTRVASVEVIKGALIGLKLAISIPQATIAHAKDIVKEHSLGEPADAS